MAHRQDTSKDGNYRDFYVEIRLRLGQSLPCVEEDAILPPTMVQWKFPLQQFTRLMRRVTHGFELCRPFETYSAEGETVSYPGSIGLARWPAPRAQSPATLLINIALFNAMAMRSWVKRAQTALAELG